MKTTAYRIAKFFIARLIARYTAITTGDSYELLVLDLTSSFWYENDDVLFPTDLFE